MVSCSSVFISHGYITLTSEAALVESLPHGIDHSIIDNAIDEWHGRLHACVRTNGLYFSRHWTTEHQQMLSFFPKVIQRHIQGEVKNLWLSFVHHHHHIRLFEVVKRNRQHTVQKIDVGIYMDIHTCRLKYIYTHSRTVLVRVTMADAD